MLSKTIYKMLCVSVFSLSFVYAQQCEKDKCDYGHIGIGGGHYGLSAHDVKSYVGYLSLEHRGVYKHRFQTALGGRIGGGSSQSPSNGVFIFDFYAKLGLNIASASTPLFINVFIEDSTYNGKIKEGSDLSRDFILLGLEADGYIPLSRLTYFDYGIGYGWIGSANYILNDTRFKVQGKNNELFQAHIGFSRHINDNTLYYINLIGKYQRTNATNTINNMSYPHSRDMIIMLEVGIKGFDK